MEPAAELLRLIAPAVPEGMRVLVLCDRGLRSPLLWDQICELGWHPIVRQVKSAGFLPGRGDSQQGGGARRRARTDVDRKRNRVRQQAETAPSDADGDLGERSGRSLGSAD